MKNSLVRVIALLVLIGTMAWSVETLDYISGEDIVVELRAAPSEVDDHHRSLVFLGAKELAIKATWRDEDLMVLKRGNTVSLGLYNSGIKNIPITILGDNGVFYQLQVRPATGDRPLSSVVRIRPGRGNAEEQRVNTNGRAEYQAAAIWRSRPVRYYDCTSISVVVANCRMFRPNPSTTRRCYVKANGSWGNPGL